MNYIAVLPPQLDTCGLVVCKMTVGQWRYQGWCHAGGGGQLMVSPNFLLKKLRNFFVTACEEW